MPSHRLEFLKSLMRNSSTPCEDSYEEACNAASLDHIIARLQTMEDVDQVRNASDSPVVINVRSGVAHLVVGGPSNQRSARLVFPLRGSKATCPFRLLTLVPGGSRNLLCRSSHMRSILSPILCWSIWQQFHGCAPLQSHSWPETREGWEGGSTGPMTVGRNTQCGFHNGGPPSGAGGRAIRMCVRCDCYRCDSRQQHY